MSGVSIPSDFALQNLNQVIKTSRIPVRQASDVQQYSFNDKVILTFPAVLSDFRHSYLTFYAQVTANGGTYVRFPYPIQCLFRRMVIYLGAAVVEDINDANVLMGMFEIQKPYSAVNNLANEGTLDATQRATDSATGREYQVRLRLQTLERVIPLHKSNVPLRVELTLDTASYILEYDGSAPATMIMRQVYYHYHEIDAPEQYQTLLSDKINTGGYEIGIHSWSNLLNASVSGTAGTIELPFRYKSLTRVIAGYRLLSAVNDPTVNNKFINQWLQRSINLSYLKVNNKIYPSDKYDMSNPQSYREIQEVMNSIMESRFHALDRAEDTYAGQDLTNRFLLAFDIRRDNSLADSFFSNGIDTSMSGSSILLSNQWASALAGTIQTDSFGEFEVKICFYPGNKVSIDY